MSQRFYVNDVQIFGNNEMFENTAEELERQGGEFDYEDLILEEMEVTDPQGLMEAVTKDSLNYLKENLTTDKKFEELTDIDLVLNATDDKEFLSACYKEEDGTPDLLAFIHTEWVLKRRRIFTPFYLWLVIKDCVDMNYNTMKMTLKKDKKIIAKMY